MPRGPVTKSRVSPPVTGPAPTHRGGRIREKKRMVMVMGIGCAVVSKIFSMDQNQEQRIIEIPTHPVDEMDLTTVVWYSLPL